MIYTSYFDNLKSLPDNIIPISICGKAPDWYDGPQYKKLAPKLKFFMEWKANKDNDYYVKCFNEQVLSKVNPYIVLTEISELALSYYNKNTPDNHCGLPLGKKEQPIKNIDICLICYEEPSEFCHRHLVADWLNKYGVKCKEWEGET